MRERLKGDPGGPSQQAEVLDRQCRRGGYRDHVGGTGCDAGIRPRYRRQRKRSSRVRTAHPVAAGFSTSACRQIRRTSIRTSRPAPRRTTCASSPITACCSSTPTVRSSGTLLRSSDSPTPDLCRAPASRRAVPRRLPVDRRRCRVLHSADAGQGHGGLIRTAARRRRRGDRPRPADRRAAPRRARCGIAVRPRPAADADRQPPLDRVGRQPEDKRDGHGSVPLHRADPRRRDRPTSASTTTSKPTCRI